MNSKLFIISLIAALTAFVAASGSADQSLAIKRAALQQRMHQRAAAGHGALKKRVATDAGKERIARAQYKPTRTPAAAPGIEKRQFSNTLSYPCTYTDPLLHINYPLGCTVITQGSRASASVCTSRAGAYQGCNPGTTTGGSVANGIGGVSAGVSSCCQTGYYCSGVGHFSTAVCINIVNNYGIANAIASQSFANSNALNAYLGQLASGTAVLSL